MHILIVDGNPLVLRALTRLIRSAFPDAVIETASTVDTALDRVLERQFDLVIADRPNYARDAVSLLVERCRNAQTPILVQTADPNVVGTADADAWLEKPSAEYPQKLFASIQGLTGISVDNVLQP